MNGERKKACCAGFLPERKKKSTLASGVLFLDLFFSGFGSGTGGTKGAEITWN